MIGDIHEVSFATSPVPLSLLMKGKLKWKIKKSRFPKMIGKNSQNVSLFQVSAILFWRWGKVAGLPPSYLQWRQHLYHVVKSQQPANRLDWPLQPFPPGVPFCRAMWRPPRPLSAALRIQSTCSECSFSMEGGNWQHWDSLGQVKSGWISARKRSHLVEFTRIHQDIWCCLIVSENYCRNEEAFCVDGSPSVTYLFCYTIELQYMSWWFCCHSLNQSCGKKPYLASGIPMFVLDERKENRKLWKSRMTRVKNFGGKVSQKNRIPHETCFLLMLWWKPKCYYFQFRVLWFGLCHPTYLPFISLNMPQPAYIPRFSPLKHPSSSITYPLRLSITLFGMGFPDIMEWIQSFSESWCIYIYICIHIYTYNIIITTYITLIFLLFHPLHPAKFPQTKKSPKFPKQKKAGLHLFKKIVRKPWSVASMTLVNVFSNLMDAALSCHRPGAIVPPARRSFGVWKLRSMVQPFTGLKTWKPWVMVDPLGGWS